MWSNELKGCIVKLGSLTLLAKQVWSGGHALQRRLFDPHTMMAYILSLKPSDCSISSATDCSRVQDSQFFLKAQLNLC